ncbi:YCF48-related protein [Flavobacterium sp. 3HN19-14]|uniref:WD40/YVTN/BNR-like repeat-containing protein n=1 Tax=Flavobacterium sp. 3HN19-14 TaxID=3448133 RepID=UPI003EDFB841
MKKTLLVLSFFIAFINTTHAQTNWDLLNPKPTASTGKDIDFVTNEIGYIITGGELLETLDAGATWLKKQSINSGNDMSFYNNTGYIVGNYGYVLKTTDGGASWSQITTDFSYTFNTVNIIDDNTVILSTSNSILRTDDGGSTWVNLNIPNGSVNKTFFTSALTGHAVCNNGLIQKTIDGGQSWYNTLTSNSFPTDFFTVQFVNQSVGFASRQHDDLFKTTDGGETWMEMPYNEEAIYDFHFLDENNGFATGEYGATYKTTNGGTTWTHIFFLDSYYGDSSMYGIYFQDNNTGYVTGQRGRILKTTDGGVTWTAQSQNYNDIGQLQFVDENIAYAQSRNNFYKTSDAGNTWNFVGSVNLDSSTSTNGFTFVDENIGYTTTGYSGGSVFKTTNGGVTWSALNNGFSIIDEGITSICFLNATTGFISGGYNTRKVMKTTNGGATWTQVFNQTFGQIQFINDQVGYANRIGYETGRMYKTTDGGTTWNMSFEANHGINGFDFVDENNGYFVGDQGLMYKTNDGGANWVKLEIPYETYREIKFQTKNIGFIADDDGLLYKTENGGLNWQLVTSQYKINSIVLVNGKIYTAGTFGKIYRSDVDYQAIILNADGAENITNSTASLTGNAASNGGPVSDIRFEYGLYYSFSDFVAAAPATVNPNDAASISVDLANLETNATYYYRLRGTQNSNIVYSQIMSFTTLPDYTITTDYVYNFGATTATISGTIVSNGYDITNVMFQYGQSPDALRIQSMAHHHQYQETQQKMQLRL